MNREDVRSIVIAELVEVQKAIGCSVPLITNETRPIGDLEKFDSPLAEDTTAVILGKIGAPFKTKCPFTMREEGKCLTLERVVDHFCHAIGLNEV